MNLNQIKYFLTVAETGNFTKASERLFISQASLSVGIKKLEEDLKVKLFERTQKQIFLTSSGKYFQNKAKEIFNQLETAKNELRHNNYGHQPLRIGILHTVFTDSVVQLLGNFCKTHSNILIEQINGNNLELEKGLERGDIDLAITVLKDRSNRNQTQILFQQNYLVAVADNHSLVKKKSIAFGELKEFPYIDRIKCESREYLQQLFAARGISPVKCHHVSQEELCRALVAAGIGLAIMPAHSRIAGIVYLPFSDLQLIRQVGLMWRPKHDSKAVSLFSEFSSLYFAREKSEIKVEK